MPLCGLFGGGNPQEASPSTTTTTTTATSNAGPSHPQNGARGAELESAAQQLKEANNKLAKLQEENTSLREEVNQLKEQNQALTKQLAEALACGGDKQQNSSASANPVPADKSLERVACAVEGSQALLSNFSRNFDPASSSAALQPVDMLRLLCPSTPGSTQGTPATATASESATATHPAASSATATLTQDQEASSTPQPQDLTPAPSPSVKNPNPIINKRDTSGPTQQQDPRGPLSLPTTGSSSSPASALSVVQPLNPKPPAANPAKTSTAAAAAAAALNQPSASQENSQTLRTSNPSDGDSGCSTLLDQLCVVTLESVREGAERHGLMVALHYWTKIEDGGDDHNDASKAASTGILSSGAGGGGSGAGGRMGGGLDPDSVRHLGVNRQQGGSQQQKGGQADLKPGAAGGSGSGVQGGSVSALAAQGVKSTAERSRGTGTPAAPKPAPTPAPDAQVEALGYRRVNVWASSTCIATMNKKTMAEAFRAMDESMVNTAVRQNHEGFLRTLLLGEPQPIMVRHVVYNSGKPCEIRGAWFVPVVYKKDDGSLERYAFLSIRDPPGTPRLYEGVMRDHMMLKYTPYMLALVDLRGAIITQNPLSCCVMGFHSAYTNFGNGWMTGELPQVDYLQELFLLDDSLRASMLRVTSQGGSFSCTVEVTSPVLRRWLRLEQGSRVWHEVHVTRLTDPVLMEPAFVVAQMDVTDRILAEKQVSRLQGQVKKLMGDMKGEEADRLVILDKIGEGGYGSVHRGVWRNLSVAVKMMLVQDSEPSPASTSASNLRRGSNAAASASPARGQPGHLSHSHSHSSNAQPSSGSGSQPGGAQNNSGSASYATAGRGSGHSSSLYQAAASSSSSEAATSGSAAVGSLPAGGATASAAATLLVHPTASSSASAGTGSGVKHIDNTLGHRMQAVLKEAAVCRSLNHPNVVSTYHFDIQQVSNKGGQKAMGGMEIESEGSRDYKVFLVQELCESTLYDVLRSHLLHQVGPFRPHLRILVPLLGDVARGMTYLHSRNIVHGDLSTSNILLKVTDLDVPEGVTAKISDFGLCQLLDPQQTHVSNHNFGTPFYVAPEVAINHVLTRQSDVFSFGVILWEAYSGLTPWSVTPEGMFVKRPGFGTFPGNTPPRFCKLAASCLLLDPSQRPTFEEVCEEMLALEMEVGEPLAAQRRQQALSILTNQMGSAGQQVQPPLQPPSPPPPPGPAAAAAAGPGGVLLPPMPQQAGQSAARQPQYQQQQHQQQQYQQQQYQQQQYQQQQYQQQQYQQQQYQQQQQQYQQQQYQQQQYAAQQQLQPLPLQLQPLQPMMQAQQQQRSPLQQPLWLQPQQQQQQQHTLQPPPQQRHQQQYRR